MPQPSASFDSEDPGDWGSDSPDEMDMYAFNVVGGLKASKEAPPKMDPNQDLTRHIYSTADGPDCPIRPLTTPVERRAWICDHCKALNNLIASIKRNYGCIRCDGRLNPAQPIIDSTDEDLPAQQFKFTVWQCGCGRVNDTKRDQCGLCYQARPVDVVTWGS